MNFDDFNFSDKTFKMNDIRGGGRNSDVVVYCDGSNIWEIPSFLFLDFMKSLDFEVVIVDNMWNDYHGQSSMIKNTFPWINPNALDCLKHACLRGVRKIFVWYFNWSKNVYLRDKLK